MSETDVSALFPKGMKHKIGDVEFEIWPIPLDDMSKFSSDDPKVAEENTFKMISQSLNCSLENAKKISSAHMNELMDGITKANKFDEVQSKHGNKIKEMIDRRKKNLEAAKNGKTIPEPTSEAPK